ncbi:MAG: hypothetical protein PXX83_08245 [Candidatus Nitrosotalea sp.]|nr:hypothetical protein [Candidatus Nitrosotalea sp.]
MTKLLVGNYMTVHPISVKPAVPFKTVINFMAENEFATLIVIEKQNPLPFGVLTEDDALYGIVTAPDIVDIFQMEVG